MVHNILNYLENSAEIFPDKVAVREESNTITYGQLLQYARKIGSALLPRNIFSKPVVVYMEKGIDALCTFFGIVAAGGFYCMFNTELPDARLEKMQTVLQTELVLTTGALKEKAEKLFGGIPILTAEDLKSSPIDSEGLAAVRARMIDTDPLYINFTSGSTGTPKGIVVAHRSVIDFIECFTDLFSISSRDIIANQAPFDFDVSVKDIYAAMKTGATLLIVPRQYFSVPTELMDYLCTYHATTLIWAVSALCLVTTFHALDYKTPESIRKVLFSGEVMPYKHLSQWQDHLPEARFVNLYGPTEITCNCTYHVLEKERDYSDGIPIGKPFPNEDVFLTDENDSRITAPDTVGNIMVRGTALALGYYREPEKNSQAFIQNPFHCHYPEPVYATGDLGKYNDRGELIFCGRKDSQIKYLGHRIELEEIEKAMAAIEGVDRCFCAFENGKLKGYYVGTIEKVDLPAAMRKTLPPFMVPGFIRKLETMPLTKNGKIDRKKAQLSAKRR